MQLSSVAASRFLEGSFIESSRAEFAGHRMTSFSSEEAYKPSRPGWFRRFISLTGNSARLARRTGHPEQFVQWFASLDRRGGRFVSDDGDIHCLAGRTRVGGAGCGAVGFG